MGGDEGEANWKQDLKGKHRACNGDEQTTDDGAALRLAALPEACRSQPSEKQAGGQRPYAGYGIGIESFGFYGRHREHAPGERERGKRQGDRCRKSGPDPRVGEAGSRQDEKWDEQRRQPIGN